MSPAYFVLLAFLLLPMLEIYLLIKVGGLIGVIPTMTLVIFTAVLGALLMRFQGLYTLNKVREALARGELPTVAMLEGVIILISGALLLTPGFFTDTLGFLGLIPPLRRVLVRAILSGGLFSGGVAGPPPHPDSGHHGPRTLEGDYRREDD